MHSSKWANIEESPYMPTVQPTSRAYWRWRVPGVCVFTQHCAPLYLFTQLQQTRRYGTTRLLTAAIFGMSPCFNVTFQLIIGVSGQPAASEVDGDDRCTHCSNAIVILVRAGGSLVSNQSSPFIKISPSILLLRFQTPIPLHGPLLDIHSMPCYTVLRVHFVSLAEHHEKRATTGYTSL